MNRSKEKTPTSNIEKALSGGGINEIPLDMSQFIQMADKEKIEFDVIGLYLPKLICFSDWFVGGLRLHFSTPWRGAGRLYEDLVTIPRW